MTMSGDSTGEPLSREAQARFDALADSFLESLRQGGQPSIDLLAESHPDLAARICDVFPMLLFMEENRPSKASQPREGPAGDRVPSPAGTPPEGAHPAGPAVAGASAPDATPAGPCPDRGRVLGEYRLIREIGRGGMGVVYEAEQPSLARTVALKVLFQDVLADESRRQRFIREARAAARLEHPSIVPVYGVGEDQGHVFYSMRLVRGPSLERLIAALRARVTSGWGLFAPRGPGTESAISGGAWTACGLLRSECGSPEYFRSVAAVGIPAAGALAHAHGEGIVHRDVKPSNLLVEGSSVWVVDFGLAKGLDSPDITRSGEIVGTLRYLAPESLDGHYDPRSDIYSLGLTLYELSTLRSAFEGDTPRGILRSVAEGRPEPPRAVEGRVPRELEAIVLRAIERDPALRYPDVRALGEDLARFQRGEAILSRPSRKLFPGRASREVSTRGGGRRRRVRAVLGVCVVLLGAVVAALALRARTTSDRVAVFRADGLAPYALGVGDMDGDDRADLVALSKRNCTLCVLLQRDSRRLEALEGRAPVGGGAVDLVLADLDGDGDKDVATANLDAMSVSVVINERGGRLRPGGSYALGFKPFGIGAGDFDGDGREDLAVSGGQNAVRLLRNEGSGAFLLLDPFAVGTGPNGLAVADLDGDKDPDIAVLDELDRTVTVLRNEGELRFDPLAPVPAGPSPVGVSLGDMDGDGDLDLAVASWNAPEITLLENAGGCAFRRAPSIPALDTSFRVLVADFDGDGYAEIAASFERLGVVRVYPNPGPGRPEGDAPVLFPAEALPSVAFSTGGRPYRLRAADLDGDGRQDLAVTNGEDTDAVAVIFDVAGSLRRPASR